MTTTDPGDAISALDRDMPCIRCGYNLRGLDVHRQCPECGEQVAISMKGRSLTIANRRWITRMTIGATLAGASIPVLFALIYCMTRLYLRSTIPIHLAIAIVFAVGACGLWIVTVREPGGPYFDSHHVLRHTLRIVGVVAGLTGVAFGCLELALVFGWYWNSIWDVQNYMATVAFPCGLIALMVLLPAYLRVLARRFARPTPRETRYPRDAQLARLRRLLCGHRPDLHVSSE